MSLFAIGDTHLSFGCEKPMDIFSGWSDYAERLEKSWRALVTPADTVVIPGDVSWGMSMEETRPDFIFLDELPGSKIILKGNHDYWWSTRTKMSGWLMQNGIRSIRFLQNDSVRCGRNAVAGTRGWVENSGDPKDQKVFARELLRLRLSLDHAKKDLPDEIFVFLHFPPVYSNYVQRPVIDLLHEYGIKNCYYGHIHGNSIRYAVTGAFEGIEFHLVSADHLHFSPRLISAG